MGANAISPGDRLLRLAQHTLDLASDRIFWTDAAGRLIYANKLACSSLEYTADEILTLHVSDISPDFPLSSWPTHWQELQAAGTLVFEARQLTKNGRELAVEVSTNILTYEDSQYTCAIVRDIAERKAKEEATHKTSQQIETIFNTMQAGIVLVNQQGIITFANQRMAAMFGCTLAELIGSGYPSHVHPDQRHIGDDRMRQLINGEIDHVYNERHFLRKDGSDFWGHLSGRRHEDDDGNLAFLIGVIADITEVKHAQQELQVSEARYRSLVESSFDVIFILEPSGIFRFVSPSWEQHFGYPASDVMGKPFAPFVHPDDVAPCQEFLQQVMISGQPGTSPDYRVRCADGSWKLFIANGSRFIDAQGEALFHGIARDVGELRKSLEALDYVDKCFTQTLNGAQHVLYRLNVKKSCYDYMSPAFAKITGHPLATFKKYGLEQIKDFFHPDDRQRVFAVIDAAFRRRRGKTVDFDLEYRFRKADGSYCWLHDTTTACFNNQDELECFFGSARDVTDRIEAEEQLRLSEERYRRFSSITSDYVYACRRSDSDLFRIQWLAGAFELITGYPEEQLVVWGCWLPIVHPEDIRRVKKRLLELKAGDANTDEFRIVRKDGEVRWIHEACRCEAGDASGELLLFGTSQDITTRKNAETAVINLNRHLERLVEERTRDLEKSNEELASFCYAVSHELRAPITRLQGFSSILVEEADNGSEEMAFIASRIETASRQLQAVVDSLLMLSRLSIMELSLEEIDLSLLAAKKAEQLLAGTPERELRLVIQPEVKAVADRNLLEICLENLLSNAIKYTGQTPEVLIEFGVLSASGKNVYFVRDNGAGFDMSYAEKLYAPFQRLHQQQEFPGIGIGLATVKRIIERHGGEIWADSGIGAGAVFYFTLGSDQ